MKKFVVASWLWLKKFVKPKRKHSPESSKKDEDSGQKQPEESQKPEKSPPDDGEEKSPKTDMIWTELHELKVLLVYKKVKDGGNKNQLCEELKNKDKNFTCSVDSIKMKFDNIKALDKGKGLLNKSQLNEEVFKKYISYSIDQLIKEIENRESSGQSHAEEQKLEKDNRQAEKQPETKDESQKPEEMKWTELHELKVLLVYKKIEAGGNKAKLIEELSNDKLFAEHGDKKQSIKDKIENIKYLDTNGKKGLEHASTLNKEVFKKYGAYSVDQLIKEIENRENSGQSQAKKWESQSDQKAKQTEDTPTDKKLAEQKQNLEETKQSQSKPEPAQAEPTKKPEEKKPEPAKKAEPAQAKPAKNPEDFIKLDGLFAFKMSMTGFYNKEGKRIPVTALKYAPCIVSQIKTKEKDSYTAVQVAFKEKKSKNCSKAVMGHLKPSGLKQGVRFIKEIRQNLPENLKLGQEASIESLKKGDRVKISSLSKGRGFAGVMKRWNFAGGRASHGSKSHRRTGSIGQHTEPARVMPGRKMPGQYGFKQITISNVPVVEILPEENMIFVKGPVPGARNTMVSVKKMPSLSP